MKVYDAASIRNVALVGHSGSGKTQLASAILADAGMINRFGKVDEGTTVTDFDEEEIARKHTLSASLAYAEWNKQKINLIDTPGIGNFLSRRARRAERRRRRRWSSSTPSRGVMVQTEKVWDARRGARRCRGSVVLNRLDRERASLERTLASLRERLQPHGHPDSAADRRGERSSRASSIWCRRRPHLFETDESGKFTEGAVPADMTGAGRQRARSADRDGRRERRTADGEVLRGRHADRRRAGRRTAQRDASPASCSRSSARSALLQHRRAAAARRRRSPTCRRRPTAPFKGIDKDGARSARARPTRKRRAVGVRAGRRSPIRSPAASRCSASCPGTMKADSTVHNKTKDAPERLGHLMLLQGKTADQRAGNQGRRPRVGRRSSKDTLTNDALGDKSGSGRPTRRSQFPEPVLAYAIEPKSRGDEDKISTSMHRLEEEDPSIRYSRDPQTKELLLSGQGQLHIEVTVAKLKRRFGVDVNLKPPRIPYRETIKASTEAHGRHKKQTGGHGQFGDCKIKVEPLAARRRLRVRRRHLRRLDPAPVRAGGRERASRTRGRAAISPAIRWSTSASPSSTGRITTSTRTSCRSSSPDRWPSRTR